MELSEQIAACLEFMHKSSQILQQVLKDPLIQDALPLPHHLHRFVGFNTWVKLTKYSF